MPRPRKITTSAEQELEKVEVQFKDFDNQVKELTMDRLNETPKQEVEPQTKLAQSEINKSADIYLKPKKTIGSGQKFNEKYRDDYNYDKEFVQFIAENREIIGENIELWTRPYGGMPAEYWEVPTNKPVWGPRYLAEQIKRKFYHRLVMQQSMSSQEGGHQFFGNIVADTTIQRLDAHPVSQRKSLFMGAGAF